MIIIAKQHWWRVLSTWLNHHQIEGTPPLESASCKNRVFWRETDGAHLACFFGSSLILHANPHQTTRITACQPRSVRGLTTRSLDDFTIYLASAEARTIQAPAQPFLPSNHVLSTPVFPSPISIIHVHTIKLVEYSPRLQIWFDPSRSLKIPCDHSQRMNAEYLKNVMTRHHVGFQC